MPVTRHAPNAEITPTPRCAVCAKALVQPARGRRRIYCSGPCRSAAKRRRADGPKVRGLVTLAQGDARAFLATLPDESVDLAVTDPPYVFDRGTTYFREWFPYLPDAAWPEVLAGLYRVLRTDRHAYVICDERTEPVFAAAAIDAGFRLAKTLIWNKQTPGLGGGVYRSQHELILFLTKGTRSGNRRDLGDVLSFPRVMSRGHYPTEKPVGLLKPLIGQSSEPGELVLDPFCGSGSTGRAARELGRRALLCDLDASAAAATLRVAFVPLESAAATRNVLAAPGNASADRESTSGSRTRGRSRMGSS